MKIEESRTMDMESLRDICIMYSLYTKGTNEEYERMLQMPYNMAENGTRHSCKNLTVKDLYDIAVNILAHSDQEGIDGEELNVLTLMSVLADQCTSTFEASGEPTGFCDE